jgi:hypothetical protein
MLPIAIPKASIWPTSFPSDPYVSSAQSLLRCGITALTLWVNTLFTRRAAPTSVLQTCNFHVPQHIYPTGIHFLISSTALVRGCLFLGLHDLSYSTPLPASPILRVTPGSTTTPFARYVCIPKHAACIFNASVRVKITCVLSFFCPLSLFCHLPFYLRTRIYPHCPLPFPVRWKLSVYLGTMTPATHCGTLNCLHVLLRLLLHRTVNAIASAPAMLRHASS